MITSIPIVDLERICCTDIIDSSDWEDVAIQIRNSLHEVGFMYLINHGVPQDVVRQMRIELPFYHHLYHHSELH